MEIYEPAEDSILIKECVKEHAKGVVLDMGTGTGILAEAAIKNSEKVYAVDINQKALEYAKKNIKDKKVIIKKSNLFSNLKNTKFDTIIFNPPYLPEDKGIKDPALYGGKHGYEVIIKFLNQAPNFLKENGIILLLFSHLSRKDVIDNAIQNNMLSYKQLAKKSIFFENLYVYKITKTKIRTELENNKIQNIKYLDSGKRGMIFTGKYKNKKVAIKIRKPSSKAFFKIENEAKWLKEMNKIRIGPELLSSSRDYVIYRFAEGKMILDYLETTTKEQTKKVIIKILNQCYRLDKDQVNKEEMHHPIKHIIIGKKVTMIDFERMHKTIKPQNVTQFCQFLTSNNLQKISKEKGLKINKKQLLIVAKKYKEGYSKEEFDKIIANFK